MPLSVVDIYQKLLPKTNCGDCGHPTCLAFASMVVSEKLPLTNCPHIDPDKLAMAQEELAAQYAAGKWTRRDMADDALQWAKERAASMRLDDLPDRVGGRLIQIDGEAVLELDYFKGKLFIKPGSIVRSDNVPLDRWEQVFIYNHLAQGGRLRPTGLWKGLKELPNTVSKMKSMRAHVEEPLIERFGGNSRALHDRGLAIGGEDAKSLDLKADVVLRFDPLPRIPVMLLFWDLEPEEDYGADVKLLFDETIVEHLDIESIMFLSERIKQLLCEE